MSCINDYKVGMTVYGKITGIKPYGAFVKFDDGVTGLIHISEISNGFVRNIDNFVQVDEYVMVKVIDIDRERYAYQLLAVFLYRVGRICPYLGRICVGSGKMSVMIISVLDMEARREFPRNTVAYEL